MATEHEIGVDLQLSGNKVLNRGEDNIASTTIVAPAVLGANTNNYNPVGLQSTSILKVSSSLAINLTGLVAPDTARNKVIFIFNVGAFNITLVSNSVLSLAQNRFNLGSDVILSPNTGLILVYDQATSLWLCFGRATTSSSTATVTGTATVSGKFVMNGDVTGTINATTNNYNPAGLSNANRLLLNVTGAGQTLTGIQAQTIGTTLIIINTSNTNNLTLSNNNVGSVGANRFLMNADVVLAPNQSCMVQYDLTNARWRVISHL